MQAKQYFKGVARALLSPVIKSLSDGFPYYGAGAMMITGNKFVYNLSGYTAYNNKIFYSAQNILVNKFTEVPLMFSQKKTPTGKQKVRKFERFYSATTSNEERRLIKTLSLTELEDHPLNDLFDSPNDYCSGIEMMEDFWYRYGFGDGVLWFETLGELSRDKRPKAIHSLDRNRLTPVQSNEKFNPIAYYVYTCNNGIQINIPREQILHLKHWNPSLSDLKGMGVDQVASIDISLNTQNNIAQGAAFVNGGRGTLFASGSTGVDKQGDVVEGATEEQMKVLRDTIKRDFSGAANNRRQYFTNGHVDAQNYGDTLAEMELVSTEDSHWKNIYTTCGVPWALSPAASSVSENSILVGFKSLVTNTIISQLRKFDQKLTQKIDYFYKDGVIATHDITEFSELSPDLKLMSEVFSRTNGPLLSEDERRSIFNFDEIGGEIGSAYLVSSGFMQVSDLLSGEMDNIPNPGDDDAVTAL